MARKPDRLEALISSRVRFAWGLALIGATVFSPHWEVRIAIAIGAAILAHFAGKRIQFAYFAVFVATIALFHLLLPFGKVLWRFGPLVVTEGALFEGLQKGITLTALVFVSLFSVSRNLRFPGQFGALWAQTFMYYEQLLETRKRLSPKAILFSVDRILERLYPTRTTRANESTTAPQATNRPRTTLVGGILAVATSAAALATVWIR